MRRLISLLLLLLLLCGCTSQEKQGSVSFVYPRKDYVSSISQGAVSQEIRDVTDKSLSYLVRLYLLGPQSEELEAIYPSGILLESMEQHGSTLIIRLSSRGNQLTEISFTFAGACLAQTCFSLCDANTVVISSGDRQTTFRRDALIFQDSTATLETALPEATNP